MPDCVALVRNAFYLAFQGSTFVSGKSRVPQLRESPADFLEHLVADVFQSCFTPKSYKGTRAAATTRVGWGRGWQAQSKEGSLSTCLWGVIAAS